MPSSKTLRVNLYAICSQIIGNTGSNPVGTINYNKKALVIDQGFSYASASEHYRAALMKKAPGKRQHWE